MKIITKGIFKVLITILLTLVLLISFKASKSFKRNFYTKVYETNLSFTKINNLYQQYFGDVLPLDNLNQIEPVFKETLIYSDKKEYLDGVELSVEENYLVPALSDGVVVFIGEKENYGKVVIVNQSSNVDIWYGNMDNIDVKLYDYVEEGSLLGKVNSKLYLVYKKNGKVLNYEEFI